MALKDLLTDMSTDATLVQDFQKDADDVIKRYGLTDDEKDVLKSGDPSKIRNALTGATAFAGVVVVVVVAVIK